MKIAASPPTPETPGRSNVRARARPGESIARAESVEPARLPEPGKVASLPGTDTPARDRYLPRGVWWRNAFLIGFLLLQLTLPLRGLVREKLETRGNFSWNMYSQVYSCEARYVLLTPTGRGEWIDPREYSRDPGRIATVFRNDWLPVFNEWLCAELGRQDRSGILKARVRCSHDFGPEVELVEPYREVCRISDEGNHNR